MKDVLKDFEENAVARLENAQTEEDVSQASEDLLAASRWSSAFKKRQFQRFKKLLIKKFPKMERDVTNRLLSMFSAEEMDHLHVKNAYRYDKLESCSSFRACLTLRSRRKIISGRPGCPEWQVEDKIRTYEFADVLGVRRPWQTGPESFPDLKRVAGSVIKPAIGGAARGVYAILQDGRAFDVFRGEMLADWEEAFDRAQRDMDEGRVRTDRWITEELITDSCNAEELPKDIKFLCFYGKAILVREFVRAPERADNWWDSQGALASVGKALQGKPLGGEPPPKAYFNLAEKISLEIPAPFMRIDFITSDEGLVINEFTPRPGTYHRFNDEWDRALGDEFLAAEARLDEDFLAGKRFDNFRQFLENHA